MHQVSFLSLSCYVVSSAAAAVLLCECANGSITHGSFVSADDALHRLLPFFFLSLLSIHTIFCFPLSSLTPSSILLCNTEHSSSQQQRWRSIYYSRFFSYIQVSPAVARSILLSLSLTLSPFYRVVQCFNDPGRLMYMCWPCGVVTGARESNSIKGIRSSSSAVGFSTLLSASVSTFFFLYIYILFSRGCISKG